MTLLAQILACHLFSAKPLSALLPIGPVKFKLKASYIHKNGVENAILPRPQCISHLQPTTSLIQDVA